MAKYMESEVFNREAQLMAEHMDWERGAVSLGGYPIVIDGSVAFYDPEIQENTTQQHGIVVAYALHGGRTQPIEKKLVVIE
ncbi:MAG: hypothetical protein HYX24_03970 [Candidatus Aenigmarchaeota archaeon]|nr:hypothetical protein [Candidatus Aenigmarchaeota archaeon]